MDEEFGELNLVNLVRKLLSFAFFSPVPLFFLSPSPFLTGFVQKKKAEDNFDIGVLEGQRFEV